MSNERSESHSHLWHLFNRLGMHHHTAHWRVVHYGFYSSIFFTILMGLETFNVDPFESYYIPIVMLYLFLQLAEILTRDALDWGEVIEGSAFVLVPAIVGLIALIHDGQIMTPAAAYVMMIWTIMAWACFFFGLSIGVKMPTVASRRTESIAPKT